MTDSTNTQTEAEKKAAAKEAEEAAKAVNPDTDKTPVYIVRGTKLDPNGKKVGK